MPADVTSTSAAGDLAPFLWIAGFAVCFALHLVIHPLSRIFRDALRWLGQNPAPLLWLMASLMVTKVWVLRTGSPPFDASLMPATTPWPDAFVACLTDAWRRFALVFHQAILPPPFWPGTWGGAALQALISATGQMWLACYFIASRATAPDDPAALRLTAARWRTILCLAVCHLPWWWFQARTDLPVVRDALLPEFFIFLAPLPLAAAAEKVDFLAAGSMALDWWRKCWGPFLVFTLTAFPLLVLLEYCLRLLPGLFPVSQLLARALLESVLASAVHVWLFVSAALLLLRSAYLTPTEHR